MAIFGNKNKTLPSVDGLYPADNLGSPLVSNAVYEYTGNTGINYTNPQTALLLKGSTSKSEQIKSTPEITDATLLTDIAQSHHYTVQIEGLNMSNMRISNSPLAKNGFLPVKTMNLKYTSYENMSIPVAIFGDFPLLSRKRVSTIDLVCYDKDSNQLEGELKAWEASCFPLGRYVAYMDKIARRFTYKGYNVKGQSTLTYQVYVIPAGNVSVSRDYGANDAKMINFSLVVVGDGRTCATGSGGDIPIIDHGGAGNGKGGTYHTLYGTGIFDNGNPVVS